MLKISKVEVFGWEAAIRGMRNPLESWDKSDSFTAFYQTDKVIEGHTVCCPEYLVGTDNDLPLMKKLGNAGPDHGKYLRYIVVQLDIEAPFYWWKEFKTYRKGRKFRDDGDEFLDPEEFEMFIETNSCSTMHKIHAKPFELDDFSHEHLMTSHSDSFPITDLYDGYVSSPLGILNNTIHVLNLCREKFLETKDKRYWWQLIQLLPSSYNQKRTVQLNYQVLKSMYHARKNHKLDEWRTFCEWIKTLPYSELITGEE